MQTQLYAQSLCRRSDGKRLVEGEAFSGRLTSQRDDMTRDPRVIEVLTIRRHVPLKSPELEINLSKSEATHSGAGE